MLPVLARVDQGLEVDGVARKTFPSLDLLTQPTKYNLAFRGNVMKLPLKTNSMAPFTKHPWKGSHSRPGVHSVLRARGAT